MIFGVSCGIRISDHFGKAKYKYRFNLIKNYSGNRVVIDNNLIRFFYSYENIESLLSAIKSERNLKIKRYGIDKYRTLIKKESNNELFNRFRRIA